MCRRRVQLGEQETRLRATGVANDESGQREAVLDEVLGIGLGRTEQLGKVLVALLILVPGLAPFRHGLAVEDQDVEEGVEKEDGLGLDRGRVEENRLAALVIEAVAVERRLNHNERVADILVVQDVSDESSLIGRVVEDLEEL